MPKYVDAEPIIADYDESIEWLNKHVAELSVETYAEEMITMQTGKAMLETAPVEDVRKVVYCGKCRYGTEIDEEHILCGVRNEPWKMFSTDYCSLGDTP